MFEPKPLSTATTPRRDFAIIVMAAVAAVVIGSLWTWTWASRRADLHQDGARLSKLNATDFWRPSQETWDFVKDNGGLRVEHHTAQAKKMKWIAQAALATFIASCVGLIAYVGHRWRLRSRPKADT